MVKSFFMQHRALVQWLKLPALKVGDRGFEPHSGIQVSKKQNISSPLSRKIQYCGKTSWPRGSVLGLRPPEVAFRILCLEGSVTSFMSQFTILFIVSWPSLAYICAKISPKTPFISFLFLQHFLTLSQSVNAHTSIYACCGKLARWLSFLEQCSAKQAYYIMDIIAHSIHTSDLKRCHVQPQWKTFDNLKVTTVHNKAKRSNL